MSHSKIVLGGAVVILGMLFLAIVGWAPKFSPVGVSTNVIPSGQETTPPASPYFPLPSSSPAAYPQNGFLPQSNSTTLAGNQNSFPAVFNGQAVTSLNDVANIIASSPSISASSTSVVALAMPAVADSDITIDASGVATVKDYLGYFNQHSVKDILFDSSRFNNVLKDENGILLFTPGLLSKAIADSNFAEVHVSLLAQKDFANAEIVFLKKIKVTGDAIAVSKQAIGMEELVVQLIDKAMAVESGAVTKNDFLVFYQAFNLTASTAHQKLLAQSGALAVTPSPSWFDRILGALHLTAQAQVVNPAAVPFGGRIVTPIPCLCDLGFWIVVGPPRPASLFVPFAFLATPLFYLDKSLTPGVWWLGLYNPIAQIPCLTGLPPFCVPAGFGGEIIMTGTSLIP